MRNLVHHLPLESARVAPESEALAWRGTSLSYATFVDRVEAAAGAFLELGLEAGERVATWLPKCFEAVIAVFGASACGGVFVPVNPLLKPRQVAYILNDCNVRVLVTTPDRAGLLADILGECHDLRHLIVTGDALPEQITEVVACAAWEPLLAAGATPPRAHRRIDDDVAAILYTSGSTGRPKGVVLSHRNMIAGAESVADYLGNVPEDRILSVLSLSFDAGFSQLTTAFSVGASVILLEYLLARDVLRAVVAERITGLAAVPPIWVQLAALEWPAEAVASLRYITNTGGAMPKHVTAALRAALPRTSVYLMYGLTEAFRSTFLPPAEVDRRPDSIGKAIPNAEILVVREDGSHCAPGEPGELLHRGALVAMGYWNDPEKTAERFRPAPGQPLGLPIPEIAVWSGDTVRTDDDGFLYFVGRRDEMIKTSGYRVSPTEVEEIVYASGLVEEAVAIGVTHPTLGQAIVVVAKPVGGDLDQEALIGACRRDLPSFMVPLAVVVRPALPRNPNGKIDRKQLGVELAGLYEEAPA